MSSHVGKPCGVDFHYFRSIGQNDKASGGERAGLQIHSLLSTRLDYCDIASSLDYPAFKSQLQFYVWKNPGTGLSLMLTNTAVMCHTPMLERLTLESVRFLNSPNPVLGALHGPWGQ